MEDQKATGAGAGLDIRPLLHYLKREPRPLRQQEPGLARRGQRPMHGYQYGLPFSTPAHR